MFNGVFPTIFRDLSSPATAFYFYFRLFFGGLLCRFILL